MSLVSRGGGRDRCREFDLSSDEARLNTLFPHVENRDFASLPRMKQPGRAAEPERGQEFLSATRLGPVSFSLVLHRVLESPLELDLRRTGATF